MESSKKGIVKAKTNAAHGLRELFANGLQDIYWAEKVLTKTIPKMVKNATSPELITALENHLTETQVHVTRLEKIFQTTGIKAVAKKCDAMEGIIKEGDHIMEETEIGVVRDAGIITAGQKVEHYEIASYGTLHAFAKTLGEDEAAKLLAMTLNEEKKADATLTGIAVSNINENAAFADEE
ncbi:ferritin-like domain-containing protein [Flavobacterium sp. GT3R68]|uniref:YciE/YciF ferroxidase family protein n=1 Tax=Flavobacterium sp. GT3R68 TaxID=2594437 RepID=UPI000F86F76E|nr:ferritin-like domain-containing protein [Flavobacterium sp. GT3R68]RTY86782.1 ferritin-like domain-containing protein [Flavobacterium sp. GSN2]TRW89384.1 ferritin-like domain-containing protein [Flavobacterium sp. GT3R68]